MLYKDNISWNTMNERKDGNMNNGNMNNIKDENMNMNNRKPNILTSIADFQLLLGTLLTGLGRGFQRAMMEKEREKEKEKGKGNGPVININKKDLSRIGNQLMGGQQRNGQSDKSRNLMDHARMAKDGIHVASTVVSGLSKQGVALSDTFWSTLIDMATGGVLDKKWSELTPELEKRVLTLAATLDAMAKNPEVVRAVRDIGMSLSLMGIDLIDAVQPSLEEIASKGWESLEKIGSTSVKGGVDTGVAFAQAMLAEIPVVGGIIDLMIAGGKGLNNMAKLANEFTEESGKYIQPVGDMIKKGSEAVEKSEQRINNIQQNLNRLSQVGTPRDSRQVGGRKRMKQKIRKTTLRIRKSLSSFQQNKQKRLRKKTLKKVLMKGKGKGKGKGKRKGN